MTFDFAGRIERARSLMRGAGVDALLLSVGADLAYLTGYEAVPLERLTMLMLPVDGTGVLVVPELEAPRVEPRPGRFEVRPWGETEDPVEIVAGSLGRAERVSIGDQTWATFVLDLQHRRPDVQLEISSPLTRALRMRKDRAELDELRQAALATDRVAARLRGYGFSGKREIDVSRAVAHMTVEEGHQVASFAIVASGPNGASPHHDAGERIIEKGDAVVVDFGGKWNGYHSDTTRTFHVGEPSTEYRRAYDVLREAQAAAVEAVEPGVPAECVDQVARAVIEEAGFGRYFIHRTGHGIGLEAHEHPYLVEGNDLPLEPGMAFSVEPGIYVPGRWGMRIEDIVAVTENGVERLNLSPRELALVD